MPKSELITHTVHFAGSGPGNTERTLELVQERAEALGINTVLVATTTGATAVKLGKRAPGLNIVAVTHSTGFDDVNIQQLMPEHRATLAAAGAHILTATHAFGGVGRAVRKKLATYQTEEIIAFTLRLFGQGMKVAAEITLMAADTGLAVVGEPVIAIGGTSRGADTAVVLLPTNAQTFFDLRFLEIICMPSPGHPAL